MSSFHKGKFGHDSCGVHTSQCRLPVSRRGTQAAAAVDRYVCDAADPGGEKTAAADKKSASAAAAPGDAAANGSPAADQPSGSAHVTAQHGPAQASEGPGIASTAADQQPGTVEAEPGALAVSGATAGQLRVASQRHEETRSITLRDVVALLERDSMYSSSTALYKLYDRLHEPT